MTTPVIDAALRDAVDGACTRIAPTWPLDRFIAVNPYWGWRGLPIADAAARLGVLAGTRLTMPRSWFADEWRAGRLDLDGLDTVAVELGDPALAVTAREVLTGSTSRTEPPPIERLPLVIDLLDRGPGPTPGTTWTAHVVHEIGQHLARRFDDGQASWTGGGDGGLFAGWLEDPTVPHTIRGVRGPSWCRSRIASIPTDPMAAIAMVLDDLAVPESGREAYLTAVLCSVNGWAAWCAFLRHEARLDQQDDDSIVELLALRLAWEWLLAQELDDPARLARWTAMWTRADAAADRLVEEQRVDWLLQAALERTYQRSIASGLTTSRPTDGEVAVEAVFCIDVRSEVFRRAFESATPRVRTRGFAGFFGLPISYTPAGSRLTRPQLPGLLAPSLTVTDAPVGGSFVGARREQVLGDRLAWTSLGHTPSAMFPFVEATGLPHALGLVADSLARTPRRGSSEHEGLHPGMIGRPRLVVADEDPTAAARLAERVLTNMGLTRELPPLVLLCGHGSTTANNPHAAGLDCGACGGHTGEINARALAHLLGHPLVRRELAAGGLDLGTTWFVAALHDTTTDTVTLFDTEDVPPDHRPRLEELRSWLDAASRRARAERAPRLGLAHLVDDAPALARAVERRSRDWSETRPEWGLAGNAAFVVAPRWRTRHLDLGGRSFLHDYDWRSDTDRSVLTLVMTAPMVVTNWINLQYHASTVDHRRYGAGDKTLHNVVGGRIGVFEGNGGDLRIGLAIQSLHDGVELQHRPLRLSVFIEAPRSHVDPIVDGHEVVRHLVAHGWLHLLRIEPADGSVEQWAEGRWAPFA